MGQRYQLLENQIKKGARRYKINFLEQLVMTAKEPANKNSIRKLHQSIKRFTNYKRNRNQSVTEHNGASLPNIDAQT